MRGQKRISPRITPITRMQSSDVFPCDSCDLWFLCPFLPAVLLLRSDRPWQPCSFVAFFLSRFRACVPARPAVALAVMSEARR